MLFNLALQKVIQSTKMIDSSIKVGKQQLNVLTYTADMVLIFKKLNLSTTTFCCNRTHCQMVRATH
jgi:hypothetical protein